MPGKELPNTEFQAFLARLRANDSGTWEKLDFVFRRSVPYWLKKVHSGSSYLEPADLDQIFNDAFSTLFEILCDQKRPLEFEAYADLRNYMFGIVKNKSRELIRQRKKEFTQPNPDASPRTELEASHRNPDQTAAFEDRDLIEKIMTGLSEQEKIIVYRFYAGEPIRDIAKSLKITESNCRIIKFRALGKLREKSRE